MAKIDPHVHDLPRPWPTLGARVGGQVQVLSPCGSRPLRAHGAGNHISRAPARHAER